MAKHVFTGVFIPAKIWISKTLIAQEKMMLAEIKALSEDSGWCYASNRHFSEWLGCLPTNISNYIQKFQKAEMIEVRYDNLKTFSGRKMRVNLAWYHGLQDPVNPSIPAEPPSIPAEPPSIPAEPPSIPAVTERQFKNTSILNERGDTPAPNLSNLQSQKNESGLVAPAENPETLKAEIPPSPNSAAPPSRTGNYEPSRFDKYGLQPLEIMEGESFAEMEERLRKQTNGTFEVTAIASQTDLPGVTIVEAAQGPLAQLTDEQLRGFVADAEEENRQVWAKIEPTRPAPTTLLRYDQCPLPKNANELKWRMEEYFKQHPEDWRMLLDNARVKWGEEKISETVLAYCLHQEKEGNMKRTYATYKAGLTTWFLRQKSYDAQNAPAPGGNARNGNGQQPASPQSYMKTYQ